MEDKIKQFLKTIKMNESLLSMLFGIVTVVLIGVLVFRMYHANKPEISENAQQATQTEKVGGVEVEVKENGEKYPSQLPESYTVQPGDHLWKIAEEQYGSGYNWVEIARANNLANPSLITAGQVLELPKVAVIEVKTQANSGERVNKIEGDNYTVVKGDNLWTICIRAYSDGYKWPEVAKANHLVDPNLIEVGQELALPR